MSVTITTDIFCDKCCAWINGHTGGKSNVRKALANARRAGWTRCRDAGNALMDLCPSCKEKQNKGR